MSQQKITTLTILVMVCLTALGFYLIRAVKKPPQAELEPVPVPVEVASIKPHRFTFRLEALGTVYAFREASVGAKVSGPVTMIPSKIELGANVKQNALLAEIDPTSFQIEVNHQIALVARGRAEVRAKEVDMVRQKTLIRLSREKLRLAHSEHNRLLSLLEKKLIAKQDVERAELAVRQSEEELERAKSGQREAEVQRLVAEAELASAQAELARAREALVNTRVQAPFSGIISEKKATLGEQVSPTSVLFHLADITKVKLLVRIAPNDINFLRPGIIAEVRLRDQSEPFQGKVEYIGPRADDETRSFPVEVIVKNEGPRRLLPGMFASAYIPVRTYPKAILIPRSSIVTRDGALTVFVADEKHRVAHRRPVTIARTFGSQHLIQEGLRSGDLLVVTGQQLLQEGATIRVVGKRELKP